MQLHLKLTRSKGLSLIELLIAMVLGLTLSAGVVQVYVSTTISERSQDARLHLQENGRFALNFLSREVRMGGYLGCLGALRGVTVNNTLDTPPASFQPEFGVQGWEAAGTDPGSVNNSVKDVAVVATNTVEWASDPGGVNIIPVVNAVPNSDIIRIWSAVGSAGSVSAINQGTPPTITAESAVGIQVNDFLILSDCEQADFVQACAVTADAGPATTSTISLSTACNPGNNVGARISSMASGANPAEVMLLQGTMFYVGKRGDTATNTPALFQRRLSATATAGVAEELIEGVESMQILYGVNLDQDVRNTVDSYLPADQVPDWNDVISVRISLLMQAIEDGIVPAPQQYTFDGVTYGPAGAGALPADNRVRRVFTNTISLRNRALGV